MWRRLFPVDCTGRVQPSFSEQLLCRNAQWFRSGRVFQAHRLLNNSTLCASVIKKREGGFCTRISSRPGHTVEYDPFIKSQRALYKGPSKLKGLMWCKFGHIPFTIRTNDTRALCHLVGKEERCVHQRASVGPDQRECCR